MRFNRLSLIIIFLVLFVGWSYLLYLNPGKVETSIPVLGTFSVPIIVYITVPIILFCMLVAFFFMGLKDHIINFLESRKIKQKDRIEKMFAEGVRLMNSDKPTEAIPIFKKVVATGKEFGEVKLQLGRAYRKMGNFEEALKWDILARQSEGNKINVL
ncbi:tetratricopeptide repeat protein, partial [bacterium]|nr:tetratricopeptide repeat protein [bacterium]